MGGKGRIGFEDGLASLSKAELPRQSRGVALELFYPVYPARGSTSCFSGDSWVIAPGSHEKIVGGSKRTGRLGDTKTKEPATKS